MKSSLNLCLHLESPNGPSGGDQGAATSKFSNQLPFSHYLHPLGTGRHPGACVRHTHSGFRLRGRGSWGDGNRVSGKSSEPLRERKSPTQPGERGWGGAGGHGQDGAALGGSVAVLTPCGHSSLDNVMVPWGENGPCGEKPYFTKLKLFVSKQPYREAP